MPSDTRDENCTTVLFCLAVQTLVERVNAIDGVQWSGWYMDDCNIIAPLSTQKEVLTVLENNASKSKASGANLLPQLMDAHGLQSIPGRRWSNFFPS